MYAPAPRDAPAREIAHIFRPFEGFKSARLVQKQDRGQGLTLVHFQLNWSCFVPHVTQVDPYCVPNVLKLSSNVNECNPLTAARCASRSSEARSRPQARWRHCRQGLTLVRLAAQPDSFG